MFKNLIKEALKNKFFEDKDVVINDYMEKGFVEAENPFRTYNYTNGKAVIVDVLNGKAYTRNGFFFSVVLKDNEYLEELNEVELLTYYNDKLASKYELEVDENEDIETYTEEEDEEDE